jgi:hypothetical protein
MSTKRRNEYVILDKQKRNCVSDTVHGTTESSDCTCNTSTIEDDFISEFYAERRKCTERGFSGVVSRSCFHGVLGLFLSQQELTSCF